MRRRRIARFLFAASIAASPVLAPVAHAVDSTWNHDGDGNWSTSSNWTAGVPNAVGDTATFGGIISADHTVTDDLTNLTLGAIDFNSSHSYTIAGGNLIALDVATGNARITVEQGSHTFAPPIGNQDPLLINVASGAALTFQRGVGGTSPVTVNGGAVDFQGANDWIGSLTIHSATVRLDEPLNMISIPANSAVVIGAGTAGPVDSTLLVNGDGNFGTNVTVTVNGSGLFDDNEKQNTLYGLTLAGSSLVNANMRFFGNVSTNPSASSAVISGAGGLDFAGQIRGFSVADGAAAQDLIINAPLHDGGVSVSGAGTTVINNAANDYTGATTITTGTLILNRSLTTSSSIGAQVGGHLVLAASGGTHVIATNVFGVAGTSQIDLKDNKMVLHNQPVGSPTNGFYNGASTYLQSGRNGGAWNGAGLVTTMSAAQSPNALTTLAIGNAGYCGYGGTRTFAGLSVVSTDTLIMYTYNGDANLDGRVNADDYFVIDSNHNKASTTIDFAHGDFNYDGVINGDDYFLIDTGFSGQGARISTGSSFSSIAAVPEPSVTFIMIGFAVLASGSRRHGRR